MPCIPLGVTENPCPPLLRYVHVTRQSLLLLSGVGNGDAVVLTCRALENDVCSVPAHVLSLLSDGCGFLLALFPPY